MIVAEQADRTDRAAETAVSLTARYRLMTASALRELRPDLYPRERSARKVLIELARRGELAEAPLYRNRTCFYRREPAEHREEFSEPAKIRAYAMLAVCAAREARRTRLTREELQKYFADWYRPGRPANYYLDLSDEKPVLGFLRVDHGGRGRWDRVLAKALDDARKHRLEPAFERFLAQGALEVRIVTALPQKANRLRCALNEKQAARGVPIHISVVPELINLIAPLPS